MESPPKFNSSYHMGSLLVSSGLLGDAWEACCGAYGNDGSPFFVDSKDDNTVLISFAPHLSQFQFEPTPSVVGPFGEHEFTPHHPCFGFLKSNTLAHYASWQAFMHLWHHPLLQNQVIEAENSKKMVVFMGHSFGGAIAIFATLCLLEKTRKQNSVFCLTFGCPLIGDETLRRAIEREGWDSKFCHILSAHDIVPRVLFSPVKLIQEPLRNVFFYWLCYMMRNRSDADSDICRNEQLKKQFANLYTTVMQHMSALVLYYETAQECKVNDGMALDYHVSPYMPFGYYVFCAQNGAVCVEDYKVIMQMLYHNLPKSELTSEISADHLMQEHRNYGRFLANINKNGIKSQLCINLEKHETKSPYDIGIMLQLKALGIGLENLQLQKALQIAREVHEQTHRMYRKMEVELSKAQAAMAELEWYKKRCRDDGFAYYDSFKQQKSKIYFRADFNRIKLARFWDDTIEMLENHESLQFFHYQGKWIYSATAYRLLVEPLDIADFYGRGKHEVCGHYLSNGRPPRHKILEKWWNDENIQGLHRYTEARARSRPASLTQDSCFWAYLEEVQHCLERSPVEAMPKLKEFEVRFTKLHAANELSDDVFLDSSSFMQWWNNLPDCYKSCSPIFNIIEKQKKVMQLHFTGY